MGGPHHATCYHPPPPWVPACSWLSTYVLLLAHGPWPTTLPVYNLYLSILINNILPSLPPTCHLPHTHTLPTTYLHTRPPHLPHAPLLLWRPPLLVPLPYSTLPHSGLPVSPHSTACLLPVEPCLHMYVAQHACPDTPHLPVVDSFNNGVHGGSWIPAWIMPARQPPPNHVANHGHMVSVSGSMGCITCAVACFWLRVPFLWLQIVLHPHTTPPLPGRNT